MIKIWFLYDPTRDWRLGFSLFLIFLLSRRESRVRVWIGRKIEDGALFVHVAES
jgi:hypothetical protein